MTNGPASAGTAGLRATWREHRGQVLALVAIVSASFVYRLYVASECSLWFDEASTLHDIDAPLPELLRGPSREHPPLMFWLVRLTTAVLGRSEPATRAVSLVFGCVLLVAVYLLALELGLGATRALIPVASLAVTPFFIRHATEARQYAMMAAFTTLATVYALRLLARPLRLSWLIGLAVCSVAAAATHFFAVPYALALWGAVAAGTARRWKLAALAARDRKVVLGVGVASVLLLGLLCADLFGLVRYYSQHGVVGGGHHLALASVWRAFSFLARPRWDPAYEALLAALGLAVVAVRSRGLARIIPLGLAFPPVAAVTLLSSGHMFTPRYLWPSFVFYHFGEVSAVLALIELVAWCIGRAGALGRRLSGVACLLLVVPFEARLREFPTGFGAGSSIDYRALQEYFRGQRGEDTALVVFVGYAGTRIMGSAYPVPHLLTLEHFEPIVGIDRYLVAEFDTSDHRLHSAFTPLLKQQLGLSRRQWRALPQVNLAGNRFQRPARARLVVLDHAREPQPPSPEPTERTNDDEKAPGDGDD